MNKKADLRDNTLSIIIAVIGLILLFTASWQIYSQVSSNSAIKKAQAVADKMEAKINAIAEGEHTEASVIGHKDEWWLTGWDTEDVDRPDKCSFETCLCVCPSYSPDSCQIEGVCRKFPGVEKIFISETKMMQCTGALGTDIAQGCPNFLVSGFPIINSLSKIYIIKQDGVLIIKKTEPTFSAAGRLIGSGSGGSWNATEEEVGIIVIGSEG